MQPGADIIAAAKAADALWRVPASVSLAQWALESGWGAHSPGCNPFGIKAVHGYPVQMLSTHEVIGGRSVVCQQAFTRFPNIAAAFDYHGKMLATAPVYHFSFLALPDIERFVSYMAAHYATDPLYASKVMAVIHSSNLVQYDG